MVSSSFYHKYTWTDKKKILSSKPTRQQAIDYYLQKSTHTDRSLDQSSHNPTSHKATTIRTLKRLAQLVCDSTDSLTDETKYLDNVFSKNNYNPGFVKRNVYKNNEPNTTNAKPITTATIPYTKGTSETIARILQPYNIRVAHKPITTFTTTFN